MRIHVFGASGTGTSTLGRALATHLSSQHFDTDDFYWQPSDPPFQTKRPIPERLALMQQMFVPRRDWVLSGSLDSWGGDLVPRFERVVFLTLERSERLRRVAAREATRYGAMIEVGGEMHQTYCDLMAFVGGYESGASQGRTLARHRDWIQSLPCAVLELDSAVPVEDLVHQVLSA